MQKRPWRQPLSNSYLKHSQTNKIWNRNHSVFPTWLQYLLRNRLQGFTWLHIHCPISAAPSHNSCCRAASASFEVHFFFFMIRHRWKRMLRSGGIWSRFLWCLTTTTTSHWLLKLHARLPSDSGSGGGIVMINSVLLNSPSKVISSHL